MLPGVIASSLFAVIALTAVPVLVFSAQIFCALGRKSGRASPMAAARPTIALLVPAHDEAAGIGETCGTLRNQLSSNDRLLVVADNCSDETAAAARLAGAEVIERKDATRIGKGFALDFGIRHLMQNPAEVLIVVDADCVPFESAIEHLARCCHVIQRPVQAAYRMRSPAGATLRLRTAEFAGIVKNIVRPLGYRRLGLPCMLMGTGMAFPWGILERTDFATDHLVEDMKLGVDLACAGFPPYFCPEATVESYFPDSDRGFSTQRTRWEHGHLAVILTEVPRLMATSVRQCNGALLAMALDIAVPPLSLLAVFAVAVGAASAIYFALTGQGRHLLVIGVILALLAVAVTAAWQQFARTVIEGRELALAPLYALAKIPLYARFVYKRQVDWVRSARKGE